MGEQKDNKQSTNQVGSSNKKIKKIITITHRGNISGEYKIFGKLHKFNVNEKKNFNESILKDKDFIKQKKYFNIEKKD